MSFDLVHIWGHMGLLSKAIAIALALMLVATVGVFVERMLSLGKSVAESRVFVQKAAPLIDAWDTSALIALADKHQASALARLLGAVVRRYDRGIEELSQGLTPVEMARNEAERQKEKIGAELRRGMSVLASVGSTAPFVGLLGTVMGIIASFQGIGGSGSAGLAAVSTGIAEALIETAFGLCVAIPAVLLFNYLTARIGTIELALARSAGELLDEMENHYGRQPEHRQQQKAA
jgi:biopolymer transport protein ExbB